jgi:hypothetical protein
VVQQRRIRAAQCAGAVGEDQPPARRRNRCTAHERHEREGAGELAERVLH